MFQHIFGTNSSFFLSLSRFALDSHRLSMTAPPFDEEAFRTMLARFEQLDAQHRQLQARLDARDTDPLMSLDPNVEYRNPGVEFKPSPAMLEALPDMASNFFQRPLDDVARRRFLHDCPRNMERDLEPPLLNRVPGQSSALQQADRQLRDLQYRAAALVRPLDWFTYQALQSSWDSDTWRTHSISMVRQTLALLADYVSHISALRRRALLPDGFDSPTSQPERYLVPPDEYLSHMRHVRAVQELTQPRSSPSAQGKRRKGKGRGKAPQQPSAASNAPSSSDSPSSNHPDSGESSLGFSSARPKGYRNQQGGNTRRHN